jgi:putative transposase
VTDEWTKEGLAIEVDGRCARAVSSRCCRGWSASVVRRATCAPTTARSSSPARCWEWIVDQGIETALIDPGKPWQNGVGESFNGKFRDECLSMEWFLSRAEAKAIIEAWRRHYNEVRPHSSISYLTPAEFAEKLQQTNAALASATGRDAARHGGFAPRPVAAPSLKGQSNDQETPVLST